jgi:hypothetical protein
MRLPALLLLLALAPALLLACNGDDAPSRQEFADEAEKICTQAQEELRDIGSGAESPEELAGLVDDVVERVQQSVDELGDLERPEGEAGEAAERFVNAVERDLEDRGIPALEEFRDAIEASDRQAAEQALEKLQAIDESDTDELAREVGAPNCGE